MNQVHGLYIRSLHHLASAFMAKFAWRCARPRNKVEIHLDAHVVTHRRVVEAEQQPPRGQKGAASLTSAMLPTSFLNRLGWFHPTLLQVGDWDLCIRALLRADAVFNIPQVLTEMRH